MNLYSSFQGANFGFFLDIKKMSDASLHTYSRALSGERERLRPQIKAVEDELQHRNRRSPTETR